MSLKLFILPIVPLPSPASWQQRSLAQRHTHGICPKTGSKGIVLLPLSGATSGPVFSTRLQLQAHGYGIMFAEAWQSG
ncbi:hypothetical protein [Laribacter hongkongensis]|uniref:hypothetical protein n=1 Tax=Laribacter hongkongensis TaxID=168471 RepID=UPI001EFDA973|nr:hypothetical protein [Laribacter hongkongensis]MCG9082168.1 hypothetical protein [Laribacter hongkongensis]